MNFRWRRDPENEFQLLDRNDEAVAAERILIRLNRAQVQLRELQERVLVEGNESLRDLVEEQRDFQQVGLVGEWV